MRSALSLPQLKAPHVAITGLQARWVVIYLVLSLLASAGAYKAYHLVEAPGYQLVALEFLVACSFIVIYGLFSTCLSISCIGRQRSGHE